MADDQDPTLKDLFRVVNDMRTALSARLDKIEGSMAAGFAQVRAELKTASEERQAIRDVIDNDIAGQGQVMALEGKIQEATRALKQQSKKLDEIGERLTRLEAARV